MVAVHKADVFGLCTGFEHLGAVQFQILDDGDAVTVDEDVAVSVFYDTGGFGRFVLGPVVSARGAFPVVGVAEDIVESAGWAGGFGHDGKLRAVRGDLELESLNRTPPITEQEQREQVGTTEE